MHVCKSLFFFLYISRIPVIGGKELDLQLLYIEVTKRGGLEKVRPFFPILIDASPYCLII